MRKGWIVRHHFPEPGNQSQAALRAYWQEADRIALAILARRAAQDAATQTVLAPKGPKDALEDQRPAAAE